MNITRGSYFVGTCLALSLGVMPHVEAAEQPYQVQWTTQIGTTNEDYSLSVAVDMAGNIYISGETHGSLGGTNQGGRDAFLTKFDPSGAELWSTQIGTASADASRSVALDAAGNAYISGYTSGSLGGNNAGRSDAFLTKFDPSGNELWSTQIGTASNDGSRSVAVDAAGNAYITGSTYGSLGGPLAGSSDAFLTKIDPAGIELWTKQIGTASYDESYSVAVDAAGNAYISGTTEGSLGGTNVGYADVFLTKFDPSGNELWGTQIGTTTYDESYSVAVDAAGNAYISGQTYGGLGGNNNGKYDAFLIKFDPSGNELWSTQIGTAGDDWNTSVVVDAAGNAYISGHTDGSLGGNNAGFNDAFLTKFDPWGNELWSTQVGTASGDWSTSATADGRATPTSAESPKATSAAERGGSDAFLIKFAIPEPASIAVLAIGFPMLLLRRR
ncbi:MAG: SBBP repeat-containing protein [Phycisphaerales bacterium]